LRRVMRSRSPPPDDRGVRGLAALPRFSALGQNTGRTTRVSSTSGAPFATTHRMRHRIHRRAAVVGLTALPALAACLAKADVHVLGIAKHTDRAPAVRTYAPHFTGRQCDLGPLPLASRQRCTRAGAATHLSATARLQLEVVHGHAERNLLQGQTVAD